MTDNQKIIALTERRDALKKELSEVEREIEDLCRVVHRATAHQKAVIDRFSANQHTVGSFGRTWWVNANGELVDMVTPDEQVAINQLVKCGIIEKITIEP